MSTYLKLPVTVEAREITADSAAAVATWCGGTANGDTVTVRTLEGEATAGPGHMMIRGVGGEFYPSTIETFLENHHAADTSNHWTKNPVRVTARQYDGTNADEIAAWCGATAKGSAVHIPNKYGSYTASPGDWVYENSNGKFFAVKPDIWERTYRLVKA